MLDSRTFDMRKEMVKAVLLYLQRGKVALRFPAFNPVIQSLEKKVNKMEELKLLIQFRSSSTKKKIRHELALKAHAVSSGVYAYAQITGNAALKNAVNYSYSDFYRPLESTLTGRCRQILNAVKKVKNPAYYGLTEKVMEEFKDAFQEFLTVQHQPASTIKNRMREMQKGEILINECISIIENQLDPLVTVMAQTDEKMFEHYDLARKMKKQTGRKRKYTKRKKSDMENVQPIMAVLAPEVKITAEA